MEDQTQKILSLQEEIINLQKTHYQGTLDSTKKIYNYKTFVVAMLLITLLALCYALIMSLLYFG